MTAEAPAALPERVRPWTDALAPKAVVDVTAIGGGITNTKWLVCLADGDALVLRWSDPAVWEGTGREHVRREALACRLLASSALPVPRLMASDVDGATAGGPANLMTWRPGRVRLDRLEPAAMTALSRLAVAVHRQPVPAEHRPPTFSFRGPAEPAQEMAGRGPLDRAADPLRARDSRDHARRQLSGVVAPPLIPRTAARYRPGFGRPGGSASAAVLNPGDHQ